MLTSTKRQATIFCPFSYNATKGVVHSLFSTTPVRKISCLNNRGMNISFMKISFHYNFMHENETSLHEKESSMHEKKSTSIQEYEISMHNTEFLMHENESFSQKIS